MGTIDLAGFDPSFHRCPVEVAIGGLDQPSDGKQTVRHVKTGQRGECLRR